jgi:hypothetical protein
MKTKYFILLIVTLILVSCDNTRKSKKVDKTTIEHSLLPYSIDLEKNLNNIKPIPLSDIGKELEYIPLETGSKSLLGRIRRIEFSDHFIFISDFYKLLQFDRKGKFIRQIGAVGRGPGEYIYVMGFCIDENRNIIYIADYANHLIKEFDFDGKFIRSFKITFGSEQFLVKDTNELIFHLYNGTNLNADSDYSLYITDFEGTSLNKIRKHLVRKSKSGLSIGVTPMFFFNSKFRFMEYGVDTLYTLKDEKLEQYAIFNLGKMKMNPDPSIPIQNPEKDEMFNKLKQKLWIRDILENKRNLLIKLDFGLSDSSIFGVYDKLTNETTFLKDNGFVNDVDGGLTFWPKYIYNDSILVDYSDASGVLGHIRSVNSAEQKQKYGDKYVQFEKLYRAMDEMSNPVLIILN